MDAKKLLDMFLGAAAQIGQPAQPSPGGTPGQGAGQAGAGPSVAAELPPQVNNTVQKVTGQSPDQLLQKAQNVLAQNPGLAQAAAIGLAGLLFGKRKSGRSMPGGFARLGGLAVIGGLAYKAFQNSQQGKALLDGTPAAAGGTGGGAQGTTSSASTPASGTGGGAQGATGSASTPASGTGGGSQGATGSASTPASGTGGGAQGTTGSAPMPGGAQGGLGSQGSTGTSPASSGAAQGLTGSGSASGGAAQGSTGAGSAPSGAAQGSSSGSSQRASTGSATGAAPGGSQGAVGAIGGAPVPGSAASRSGSAGTVDALEIPQDSKFHPVSQTEDDALLFLRTMVAAAMADGRIDQAERSQLMTGLTEAGIDAEATRWLEREMGAPADVEELAAGVTTPEKAAQVYAAARIAIDPDTIQEREFLRQLAAALDLDQAMQTQIDSAANAMMADA